MITTVGSMFYLLVRGCTKEKAVAQTVLFPRRAGPGDPWGPFQPGILWFKSSVMAFCQRNSRDVWTRIAKGRTVLLPHAIVILFCHVYFLIGGFLLLYSFFSFLQAIVSMCKNIVLSYTRILPLTLPEFLLLLDHSFCPYLLIPPGFTWPLQLSEVMVKTISLPG